jgi:hypothetical protein
MLLLKRADKDAEATTMNYGGNEVGSMERGTLPLGGMPIPEIPEGVATTSTSEHTLTLRGWLQEARRIRERILERPCPPAEWDEIFADKLSMGQQPSALDLSEVSGDDLLL